MAVVISPHSQHSSFFVSDRRTKRTKPLALFVRRKEQSIWLCLFAEKNKASGFVCSQKRTKHLALFVRRNEVSFVAAARGTGDQKNSKKSSEEKLYSNCYYNFCFQ